MDASREGCEGYQALIRCAVDYERYPQMGFLYYMMMVAKEQIRQADPVNAYEYIDIIEQRWDYQMGRELHLAGKNMH